MRRLRVLSASVDRPDERHIPVADRQGAGIAVYVANEHLKGQPVDAVRLTEDEAVRLAHQLLGAVVNVRMVPR